MMEHKFNLDGHKVPDHICLIMSTDAYSLLLLRRKEIVSEVESLRAKIQSLELEDAELESAARILSRFGAAQPDFVIQNGEETLIVQAKDTPGKPAGTPTTPNMIIALLREAVAQGKPGLEPREMQISISRRWWPSVKSEDVGPTAWRMWKDGRLVKNGSLYMLKNSSAAADLLGQEAPAAE